MPEGRPAIPAALKRAVLVEAGHRCAIPTCKSTPVELAHIVPWSEVQTHDFDNIIALCPTCPTRFDRGDIDRKSMLQYKANLAVISSRYSDLERRVLEAFMEQPDANQIELPGGLDLLLRYLVADDIVQPIAYPDGGGVFIMGMPQTQLYQLTLNGRKIVDRLATARPIDSTARP